MEEPLPVRFGAFEVDPESGELRKSGVKIKLQEKPFEVLVLLLENPGKLVRREELRKKLWPSDSFVDFDHNINAAIGRLREALGDSAENPRYIETLARRGYRFIGPVERRNLTTSGEPEFLSFVGRWLRLRRHQIANSVLSFLGVVGVIVIAFFAGRYASRSRLPSFHQLTFRRGLVHSARFSPDGHTVIYGATWNGNPVQLFWVRPESPESRDFALGNADILSISPTGEMAILLRPMRFVPGVSTGTLARLSMAGGAPREMVENVQQADWAPDGSGLAIVRRVGDRTRLEFPIGKVLYETPGWISHPRFAPKGGIIAFINHPMPSHDDRGSVEIVDLVGRRKTVAAGWETVEGLAWHPITQEIWFTAAKAGSARLLYAVTASGKQRMLARMPGTLTLHDVSREGHVLMGHGSWRVGLMALPPGEDKERELSWLDASTVADISQDGKTVLFDEQGEGSGANYTVYSRNTDGSPAVRLGEGRASALSPDGKWALSILRASSPRELMLWPTAAGNPRRLSVRNMNYVWATFFPDGQRILVIAEEPGHHIRSYIQRLDSSVAQPITPEGTFGWAVSPDSRQLVAVDPKKGLTLYPLEGGEARVIAEVTGEDQPIGWSADGQSVFILRGEFPAKIYRLEVATGHMRFWKDIMPSDPSGFTIVFAVRMTPTGKSYAYSYSRFLSDLYLVEGLK